jgi:hypothetical protein
MIFAALSVAGVFASLARGTVRGGGDAASAADGGGSARISRQRSGT